MKGLSARLRPARGYAAIASKMGPPVIVRAPMEGWRKRRAAANAAACITGYDTKLSKIRAGKGNHNAVCNPTR